MGVIDDIKTNLRKAYTKLETKGATIPAHKNMENLESTINSVTTGKEEQTKTVGLSMENGDQIVTPDTNKVLSQVTITKPETLIAGNIKKDVNIGGVIGSFEGGANIFNISTTLTNCTGLVNNPTIIEQNGTATLAFHFNTGFAIPTTITVTGASYTWDDSTGLVVLSNPTSNISITITATGFDAILENNTWSAIKQACEAGDTILSTWLGQTKSSTYNGSATSFRLVDTYVGRYKFTDDNSDSHAVFEMVDCTSNTFAYQESGTVTTYNASMAKTIYDTTNYNYLESNLKNLLKNTTVKSGICNSKTATEYPAPNCKIFPASVYELYGNYNNYILETNGGQFAYYVGTADYTKIKYKAGTNNLNYYILRSPNVAASNFCIRITTSGGFEAGTPSETWCSGSLCFAF